MEANSQISTRLNIEKQRYHPYFKHRFSSVQNQKLNIRYFSKGFFPNGNFPRVRVGQAPLGAVKGCNGDRALRLGQTWEVAALEIAHLGSCYLGKCNLGSRPWENAFGKVPNTKNYTIKIHNSKLCLQFL